MTVIRLTRPVDDMVEQPRYEPRHAVPVRVSFWRVHWQSFVLVLGLVVLCVVVTATNMENYPARFKDEGVYLSQAWAVKTLGQLAHYTYWYDHPPVGWIQLSLWITLTDGFNRHMDNPLAAGREFMVFVRAATSVILFMLARRLGLRRFWATVAVLLFVLSPLSIHFGRYVLLDSIALPWLLASFVLVYSPQRRITAIVGAVLCLTMALLTKETLLVVAPVVLYAAISHYRGAANRKYVVMTLVVLGVFLPLFYPLYANVKNELFSGEGHVSLADAVQWQLVSRAGSGSVFDPSSDTRELVDTWLGMDPWLCLMGVGAILPALMFRRLRPVGIALLIQVLLVFRTGYMPFMYIIAMLPFMALLVAGVADRVAPRLLGRPRPRSARSIALALAASLVVATGMTAFGTNAAPVWSASLQYQMQTDADKPQRDAVAWVEKNIPRDKLLVVEGEAWLDYVSHGYANPQVIWVYKVDTDPEVQASLDGWQNMDYLVLSRVTLVSENAQTFPLVYQAINHADIVWRFGSGEEEIVVMKVRK